MDWLLSPLTWLLVPGIPLLLALWPALRPAQRPWLLPLFPFAALPALAMSVWGGVDSVVEVRDMMFDAWIGQDELGRLFLFNSALLWLISGWYARGYLAEDPQAPRFVVFSLLTMAGNFGVILAQDAVTFYLFFALMSLASYGIIVHAGDPPARRAGRVYIVLVMCGEILLFTGIILATFAAGTARLPALTAGLATSPWRDLTLALLVAGFAVKVGALPLHMWLPLAHPAAPTPASAILSGALIKAGLLGWMRFLPLGETALPVWGTLLMMAGLAAAYWGALAGITQQHPKTVLAYSSISQMGLMTVGIGAAVSNPARWPALAAAVSIYALHHGLAKGALFLGVGVWQAARSSRAQRLTMLGLVVSAAALVGAPFSSGAVAKLALKSALEGAPGGWDLQLLLALAATGTTLIMARLLWRLRVSEPHHSGGVPGTMWAPWAVLVVASQAVFWFLPWNALPGAAARARDVQYVWLLAWPILLGMIAAGFAALRARRQTGAPIWEIPPGDILLPLEWCIGRMLSAWQLLVVSPLAKLETWTVSYSQRRWQAAHASTSLRQYEWTMTRWAWAGLFLLGLLLALALTMLFANGAPAFSASG